MRKILILFLTTFFLYSCSKPGDLTIGRAMRAYQTKNYEEALKFFKASLEEESNYSQELIYNFIASIYLQQDDLENAVVYQELSCEKKPEYRAFVSLGMNYHLLGQDDKAEEIYKKAIDFNPEKGEAYASLGALYLGQKKIDSAIENLKIASEKEPKIAVIHANLGVAYAFYGEDGMSEKEFKIAEELKCENLEEFKARAESFGKNFVQ